jgi:hypothetical protein
MKRCLLFVAVMVLAGCGARTTTDAGPVTVTSGSTAPPASASEPPVTDSPLPRKPTPTPKPTDETTIIGVVEEGVEHGCIMLRTTGELYQLVGTANPIIKPGARLRVTGRPNPTLITTCQQGTPFQVVDVRPA